MSLKITETGTIGKQLGTVSYSPSIVTMALSCISEISELLVEIKFFNTPCILRPVRGSRRIFPFCMEKREWCGYPIPTVKKV